MIANHENPIAHSLLHELAEFRYLLRRFLQFSEEAATRAGLTPQQHQLLLQVAAATPATVATVGYVAERLALRHHSAVELSKRCEESGYLVRTTGESDSRYVILSLTSKGHELLRTLSADHTQELFVLGPKLIEALAPFTTERCS